MPNQYVIEDLGPVAHGNAYMRWTHARHPKTGEEFAAAGMSKGGLLVVNPRTRKSIHVKSPSERVETWALEQSPADGAIYIAGYSSGEISRWNWEGDRMELVATAPTKSIFTIDVAMDGKVYIPDHTLATLFVCDPKAKTVETVRKFGDFGGHTRNCWCGKDGYVYVSVWTYGEASFIVAYNPRDGSARKLEPISVNGRSFTPGHLFKDGDGRVLAQVPAWGRNSYVEIWEGKPRVIANETVRLTSGNTTLAFDDGSYMTQVDRDPRFSDRPQCKFVDAQGKEHTFEIERPEYPLRIFSIESGGGKIWCGTFIPLQLASYDPATKEAVCLGNPTKCNGEIYSMVFTQDKLYTASYTDAPVARYIPGKPWRKDDGIYANPAHLGYIKEEPPHLHRPYGKALDKRGNVYFASKGSYDCFDSGIARIDPRTEEFTRWLYPKTTFTTMAYVASLDQLLVTETRDGEQAIRFTFISPSDGKEVWSEPVIQDKGEVVSLLDAGDGEHVYGLHAYRACVFAFSLKQRKIVKQLPELRVGDHCHNTLMIGLDGRIWGLTNQCVWAVDKELKTAERIADYPDFAEKNFYRFNMVKGPDGAIYFPNGYKLMRLRKA